MNTVAPMKNRSPWTKLMATILPVWFGLVPLQAEAVPDEVGASSTIVDQLVPSDAFFTTLLSVPVFNPGPGTRVCIATCSADALNPAPLGNHQYRFRVSLNGLPANPANPPGGPFERTLQFLNQQVLVPVIPPLVVPLRDNSTKEITTTGGLFLTPPGFSFIRCEARKFFAATPNLTVDDSSLTVSCTDTPLP